MEYAGIISCLVLVAGTVFSVFAAMRKSKKDGEIIQAKKQQDKVIQNTKDAKKAASRVSTDPDYRKRVRDRFDNK